MVFMLTCRSVASLMIYNDNDLNIDAAQPEHTCLVWHIGHCNCCRVCRLMLGGNQ